MNPGSIRVEPGVETGMVATWEGDHDLANMLHHLVVGDAVLPQDVWRDETHLVPEIAGAVFFQLGEKPICQALKPFSVLRWDGVPEFRSPKVEVVDAVQVHVLSVPSKCGFPAAKIQIGRVHSIDLNAIVFLHIVQDGVESVDVPACTGGVCDAPFQVGPIQWRHKGNVLPILPLEVLKTTSYTRSTDN